MARSGPGIPLSGLFLFMRTNLPNFFCNFLRQFLSTGHDFLARLRAGVCRMPFPVPIEGGRRNGLLTAAIL
jgi:hypothetical protein